jgi:hypothetical protein
MLSQKWRSTCAIRIFELGLQVQAFVSEGNDANPFQGRGPRPDVGVVRCIFDVALVQSRNELCEVAQPALWFSNWSRQHV